jgi:diguanylate cyclase (GGDEF)-like protein
MKGTRVQATVIQALLTALAVILLLASLSAHGESYSFRTYQRPEGLENLNIHCMVQDHNGQLLLCTENGVFRFDGARMNRVPSFEDHDLPFIQALAEDRANRIWVANMHELIYLDGDGIHRPGLPRFGTHQVAENRIAMFPQDHDQIYFMADRQIYRVSSQDHGAHWRQAPVFDDAATRAHPELKLAAALVAIPSFSGDSANGTLWMACGRHLCSASASGKNLQVWGPDQGIPDDDWETIFRDHRGRLWARSNEHIVSLSPGDSRFVAEEHGLTAKSLNLRNPTIIEDPQGRVLINLSIGLGRMDGDHWHVFGPENDLPQEWISSMLADRQGSMWLSVIGHGLMRWIGYGNWEMWKDQAGLGVGEVWGMAEDRKGTLWAATDLDLIHVPSGPQRRAEPQGSGHPMHQGFAVAIDPSEHVWLGDSTGNVRIYDPVTHQARLLPMQFKNVSNFLVGPDGAVWVCSAAGLYRLDPQDGYRTASREVHGTPIPSGVFYRAGYAKGMYYFVSERGLFTLNAQGVFTEVKMPAGVTFVLDGPSTVAPDGTLWLQGEGSPLIHLRIHGNVAELVERVGSPQVVSPSVYQISFDQRGWMWVGTDRGVDVFNGHEWTGLTTEDGLVWDDTDALAFYPASDGSVWIGTSGGLSHILHPEKIFQPQPLTIEVNNARIGGTSILNAGTTKVAWRDRGSLSIQLGVSNPSRAAEVRYRFRMEHLENEWQDTDEHQLRYSALPPGKYRLAVMAVDPRRHQESAPVYIEFRLLPPWYRTNWFLCLLALTLACLVGLGSWWRVSALMARQLRLEDLVRERTRQLEMEKKELIEARLALVEQASRDGLTGLLNRSAIFDVLTTEIIYANEKNAPLAIVLADLDHFKRINDTYGHQVGDSVLRECARRFNLATRPTDYVGRYGGEELLLVMPGLSQENSMERLENLRATIAHELFDCDGIGLPVTCSFGVAWIDDQVRTIKPLIALADQALYAAKTRGRNRVETMASASSGLFFPDGSGPLVATR